MSGSALRVGGFVPFTATDYPDHLAAVVFCQGCPWRCVYCHNPHLLGARGEHEIAWSGVMDHLARRRGMLDALVFSGGEPTLQTALPGAIREVKALGYRIGLHTAGMYPRRLAEVLPLVDWIGFDVKAAFADYALITRTEGSGARARASLELVQASGAEYQIRTTVDSAVLTTERLDGLSTDLTRLGVRQRHVQQVCRPPVSV